MCAYFFAIPRPVDTQLTSPEHIQLKEMITNPLFNEFTKKAPDVKAAYKFNNQNEAHWNVIKDCTRIAQQKLEDSVAIDKEAALVFAIGIAATSFLPFGWIISPLAFMYCGYLVKERIPTYEEYTQSLDNLVRCASWALNNDDTTQADIDNADTQAMLTLLKQVMTKKQLADIIVDNLENKFFATALIEEKLLDTNHTTEQFKAALERSDVEKAKNLVYNVYGYKQGGSIAAMVAKVASYLQTVLRQAASACYEYISTAPAPGNRA